MKWPWDMINPNYIKMNIDGIPTATGAMLEPYVGTNDRGLNLFTAEALAEELVQFGPVIDGFVFNTIGDSGARLVFDAIEIAREKIGRLPGRTQLAHAHFIAPADLPRMKDLDVTAKFSPVMWFEGGMNTVV